MFNQIGTKSVAQTPSQTASTSTAPTTSTTSSSGSKKRPSSVNLSNIGFDLSKEDKEKLNPNNNSTAAGFCKTCSSLGGSASCSGKIIYLSLII